MPELVHQGRQALRNLQRVARLYLTKSSFAAFLILTIGTTSTAYPLLPRHLTIAAAVTIGIPTFFLALAPSTGPWHPGGFARRAARFAVPAGMIVGVAVVASYLFALHNLGYTVREARVVATTVLVIAGLYLVYGIEAAAETQDRGRDHVLRPARRLRHGHPAAVDARLLRARRARTRHNHHRAGCALLAVVTLFLAGFPPANNRSGARARSSPGAGDFPDRRRG